MSRQSPLTAEDLEDAEAFRIEAGINDRIMERVLDVVAVPERRLYNQEVIDPIEFIENPTYMNAGGVLWEKIKPHFLELNSGEYTEALMTGGIGSGKTSLALYTQAYQLYLLSCYKNPHELYDLDPASEIEIICFRDCTS